MNITRRKRGGHFLSRTFKAARGHAVTLFEKFKVPFTAKIQIKTNEEKIAELDKLQEQILQFTKYTVPHKFAGLLSGISTKIKNILGERIKPELKQVLDSQILSAPPNSADMTVLKQLTMFVALLSKTPGSILLNLKTKTKAKVGGTDPSSIGEMKEPSGDIGAIVEMNGPDDNIDVKVMSLETTLSEYFMFLKIFVALTVTGMIPLGIVGVAIFSPLLLFNLFVYLFPETAKSFNLTSFEFENNHNGGSTRRKKKNFGRKTIYKTHIS